MTDIGGGWYTEKSAKGISLLRRTTLSKKAQENQNEIQKNIYEANKWGNDWIFQLHWHKLEQVDPKSTAKRDKPYSVSLEKFYLNKNDRTAHWVGYSKIKELDINYFFNRKQTNEKMEAELTEMDSRIDNLAISEEANVDEAITIDLRKE